MFDHEEKEVVRCLMGDVDDGGSNMEVDEGGRRCWRVWYHPSVEEEAGMMSDWRWMASSTESEEGEESWSPS